jgi:hypothetical protein
MATTYAPLTDAEHSAQLRNTRRLLGNLFEFEDLGAKDLKGIAGPVRAWAALRASSAANSQLSTLLKCRKQGHFPKKQGGYCAKTGNYHEGLGT